MDTSPAILTRQTDRDLHSMSTLATTAPGAHMLNTLVAITPAHLPPPQLGPWGLAVVCVVLLVSASYLVSSMQRERRAREDEAAAVEFRRAASTSRD